MEKLYKIEKPDLTNLPKTLDDFDWHFTHFDNNKEFNEFTESLSKAVIKSEYPEYLSWKDIKYKNWIPNFHSLNPKWNNKSAFFAYLKAHRKSDAKPTPICCEKNGFFTWRKLANHEKMAHEIDMDMSKYLLDFPEILKTNHHEFQRKSLIEEAIASSQLEGAHTSRKVAKQMIEEKREPRNADERMILNNYLAMKEIQENYKNKKLTLKNLFALHKILTKGTASLEEFEQGNFRSEQDEIVIVKGDDPAVISYRAPSLKFVKKEIQRLIDFANDELGEPFIHPLTKAIMLHFWIGLLHPFVDGNGRMARCLFYWYLLRKSDGYQSFALLPISLVIKNSSIQYSEAYILSEQDDNDLTYFIDYNYRKIAQAAINFKKYISYKLEEEKEIEKIMAKNASLNTRQIRMLKMLEENPYKLMNVSLYVKIFEITKATAVKDLKELQHLNFVKAEKRGKNVFYHPTGKKI